MCFQFGPDTTCSLCQIGSSGDGAGNVVSNGSNHIDWAAPEDDEGYDDIVAYEDLPRYSAELEGVPRDGIDFEGVFDEDVVYGMDEGAGGEATGEVLPSSTHSANNLWKLECLTS